MTKGTCSKIKHKDKAAADAVVYRLLNSTKKKPSKMRSGYLMSYQCSACKAWHVGHRKGRNAIIQFIDKVIAADAARKKEYSSV